MHPTAPNILEAIPELEKDIPVESFAVQSLGQILLIVGVVVAVILGVVLLLILRRGRKLPPPPGLLDNALAALQALEQSTPPLRECSLRVSMILRTYLAGQTQDPALFETHEEFSRRMDSLSAVPAACREQTRELLESLAEYKYAGGEKQDPLQVNAMVTQARDLLHRIHETQAAEAAAAKKRS